MRKFFKKLLKSNAGTALVELAMILPVLFLVVVGTLDMGSMFMRKMEIANAAKAGVQYALVRKPTMGDLTMIGSATRNALGHSITDSTAVNVELYCMCHGVKQICTDACTDVNISAFVTVTIRENYTTPFFNYDWFQSSFPITESSTVKLN